MSKRYKEFLIDILTKTYQIIFGVAIITPIAATRFDLAVFFPSILSGLGIIIWAGAIASRITEELTI
ncbi:hypothetical protein HZB07_05875 [Candidatus Saganbacteria bacterium]|nr:hypothetical protein [Candidatus Saganbacteria bacterium]